MPTRTLGSADAATPDGGVSSSRRESLALSTWALSAAGCAAMLLSGEAPGHAVVAAACDQPRFSTEAVDWLLAQRRPGTWAVLPRRPGSGDAGPVEPLGALYEPQARGLLEPLLAEGGRGPRAIAGHPKVAHPVIPDALARCWTSIDTPDDLARLGEPC